MTDALRYAQEAVHDEEQLSLAVDLSKLVVDDLKPTINLGAYWDTLGWVYFRKGNLKEAEGYLYAAWMLRQDPVAGNHLAQVYESQKRKQEAAKMYRLVETQGTFSPGADEIDAVAHAKKQLEAEPGPRTERSGHTSRIDTPAGELTQDRTITLPQLVMKLATADFFLAFGPASGGPEAIDRDAVVQDTKFVAGSDLLRSAGDALRKAHFKVTFPNSGSARLVRRGLLACNPLSGCMITLLSPEDVRKVD